jgi:hypothetical protein
MKYHGIGDHGKFNIHIIAISLTIPDCHKTSEYEFCTDTRITQY